MDNELNDRNIADLMRGDGAEQIRNELEQSMRVAIEVLAEIINQWNDACEDGDRGRCEDAIVLIVYDDGSGKFATYYGGYAGVGGFVNVQRQFDTVDEAVEILREMI